VAEVYAGGHGAVARLAPSTALYASSLIVLEATL
jgi:hypothetical protein